MSRGTNRRAKVEILVVEDHPDSREMLVEYLEAHGFVVKAAADGLQALAQLESGNPPAAILTDLHMPQMDGWSLRAALAKDPRFADIPVIVLTAVDPANGPQPVHASIQKPLDLKRVVALLQQISKA